MIGIISGIVAMLGERVQEKYFEDIPQNALKGEGYFILNPSGSIFYYVQKRGIYSLTIKGIN